MSLQLNFSQARALLFDLDGTLIDSSEDIAAAANALRETRGLESLPLSVISSYIGDGIESLVARLLPGLSETELEKGVEEFRSYYFEHCVVHTHLYEGVREALESLSRRGYSLAVVTNKPERISARILELLGVRRLFGAVVGGKKGQAKKPDPEPLQQACKILRVNINDSCMIGDSRVDIEAARNAGIPAVAVLGGIGDEALLRKAAPDLLVERFRELENYFTGRV